MRNVFHFAQKRLYSDNTSDFSEPNYFTLGLAWKKKINLFLDNQLFLGYYGGNSRKYMRFWFVRAGVEKFFSNNFSFRFGMTNPIIAQTTTLGDLRSNLPNPKFSLSGGAGYKYKNLRLDVTVSVNPGLSYVKKKPVPAIYLSSTYRY